MNSPAIDSESGATNGAPPFRRNSYKAWATIFSENFERNETFQSAGPWDRHE